MIMPFPRRMSRRVFSSAIRRATCALDKPVSGGLYFPVIIKWARQSQQKTHVSADKSHSISLHAS